MTRKRQDTQSGESSNIEKYKSVKAYKSRIKIIKDELYNRIEKIYKNNHWNLQDKFKTVKASLVELQNEGQIAWENGIQYLDFPNKKYPKPTNKLSLKKFKEGEYKGKGVTKVPNTASTEKQYATRVEFWTKTFPNLKSFDKKDDLHWIIAHNRLILYEILRYHNEKKNQLATLNKDLKTIVRCLKLIYGEENELKMKFSALQIGINDIENLKDDQNQVATEQEVRTFVPYEQLLDVTDGIENQYKEELNKLPASIRNDPRKHPDYIFHLHQRLLAFALYVWDFPSRREKLTLTFITDEKKALKGQNHVLIANPCKMIFGEIKKRHEPISYNLSSTAMLALNKRLSKLLNYSYKTYKRTALFISANGWSKQNLKQVGDDTVAGWIREYIPTKNIGVDTFRSAFASYYLNLWNNNQKTIMAQRMRTSILEINRAYYKQYNNPDTLVQVKIEPSDELVLRSSQKVVAVNDSDAPLPMAVVVGPIAGQAINNNNAAAALPQASVVRSANPAPVRNLNPPVERPVQAPKVPIHERKAKNFKNWYSKDENKQRHRAKVQIHSKLPTTYAKRIVRELNNGVQDIKRLKQTTVTKYGIKKKNGVYVSDLL